MTATLWCVTCGRMLTLKVEISKDGSFLYQYWYCEDHPGSRQCEDADPVIIEGH